MTPQEEFDAFLGRVTGDPGVLGVVLSGSRAREGVATAHSDYDVTLVTADGVPSAEARRDARLDVSVMPLAEFREHALPGSGTEWNRYAFTRARVLKDTAAGLVGGLVAAKGRLTPSEAAAVAPAALDAFLNGVYRCLKNARDGDATGARLDAAEALPHHLTYVFALHGRVRPYNKYLAWELDRHPLPRPEWSREHLLGLLSEALSPAAAPAVRRLLTELEPHARAAGHGSVLDSWGDDLRFMLGHGECAAPDGGGHPG
ncbi:hypothetical protein [Sphaerisporangium aureirubrum]|uniref:Nucleotidyltransferase domain-containing protein n=1 Tax=Sphaerisporangium aureirubrum TaxID=1544736 RepID=A0ABW1NJC3_9ACTN